MLLIKTPLRFNVNNIMNFNPTDDNLKQYIIAALVYETDEDFFDNVVNNSNLDDKYKEKIIWYLNSTDVNIILKYCKINYDSIIFDYLEGDTLVYNIDLYFDENIAIES